MTTPHHNRFMALFPGPPGWAGARRELLDFMVKGEINSGRHTDHPAGRHSIRTNQCSPLPSPIYFYRPDALHATQPTVSKHWRQLCHCISVIISSIPSLSLKALHDNLPAILTPRIHLIQPTVSKHWRKHSSEPATITYWPRPFLLHCWTPKQRGAAPFTTSTPHIRNMP